MCGGSTRWRARAAAPVSPVRSSMRMPRPHLGDRGAEVAADVGGQRLQRRDVEGVQPRRRGGAERDQARQEARQRLAAAGRGDQQRRRIAGAVDEVELVGVRCPAPAREPGVERGRQRHRTVPVGGGGATGGRKRAGKPVRCNLSLPSAVIGWEGGEACVRNEYQLRRRSCPPCSPRRRPLFTPQRRSAPPGSRRDSGRCGWPRHARSARACRSRRCCRRRHRLRARCR